MSDKGYLAVLLVLLVVLSIGVAVELKHLYSIPEKMLKETSSSPGGREVSNNTYTSGPASEEPVVSTTLLSFKSLDELGSYLRAHSSQSWVRTIEFNVYGTVATTLEATTATAGAKPASYIGMHYSETNVQVPGIDEADIAKTDGQYLYVISRNRGSSAVDIVRIYPFREAGVVSVIKLGDKMYPVGLLLRGDLLIIIAVTHGYYPAPLKTVTTVTVTETSTGGPRTPQPVEGPVTTVLIYNVSSREKPVLVDQHNVTGSYIDARLLEGKVLIVAQQPINYMFIEKGFQPLIPIIDSKPLSVNRIFYAPDTPPSSYAVIALINLDTGSLQATSVLSPPVTRIYVSRNATYLFSEEWNWRRGVIPLNETLMILKNGGFLDESTLQLLDTIRDNTGISDQLKEQLIYMVLSEKLRELSPQEREELKKYLYKEAEKYIGSYIGPATHIYSIKTGSSGWNISHTSIEGRILDQFAIDEYRGTLRLAVTANIITGYRTYDYYPFIYPDIGTVNNIYVLNATNLELVGLLEGLSPGERVYSARYMGDILYLVTFRRVDPLYAIDLSDPHNPKVLGYAKMPGYSEYLHPINNTLLFGIGYSTDEAGRINGVKASLYNITDPLSIESLSDLIIAGRGYSQVIYDHHAFLYNPWEKYVAFPLHYYNSTEKKYVGEALIIGLDDGKLYVEKTIRHEGVFRILYIDRYIVTLSLDTLKITGPGGEEAVIKL